MNNRDYLKVLARNTVKISEDGKYKIGNKLYEFDNTDKTILYKPQTDFLKYQDEMLTYKETIIEVVNESTVDAIFKLSKENHKNTSLGVLNFASAYNPGGGFLNGSMAQEECLAYCSDLYRKQTHSAGSDLYMINRTSKNVLYTDTMSIGPVTFFRNSRFEIVPDNIMCTVLTCPAVNMKKVRNQKEISIEEAKLAMKNRMRKVLYCFAYSDCNEIVLGAWGAGVFGNNPKDIARYWYELLIEENMKQYFTKIRFSILDKDNKIIDIFKNQFN